MCASANSVCFMQKHSNLVLLKAIFPFECLYSPAEHIIVSVKVLFKKHINHNDDYI